MRQSQVFSTASIKALRPRERRYELREAGGLGVLVDPKGSVHWYTAYVYAGKRRKIFHGTFPAVSLAQAREAHQKTLALRSEGDDPKAKRTQQEAKDSTFAALCDSYITRYAKPRKSTWERDRRYLEIHCLPRWGRLPADAVKRAHVREVLESVAAAHPTTANRLLAVIRKLCNWAVSVDLLEVSPAAGISRPAREVRRERVLSDEEVRLFWDAAPTQGQCGLVLQAILLTARRPGEVCGVKPAELSKGRWTIPSSRTKQRQLVVTPVAPVAERLLRLVADAAPRPDSLPGAAERIRTATGMAHWTPHDLRRTAASMLSALGTPRLIVSQILGHSDGSTTAIYDRYSYEAEKRQALEALERRIMQITTPDQPR